MSGLAFHGGPGDIDPGTPPATPAATPKRTAAGRLLALLGAFSHGGGSLTLSEIARHAELSLPTAHRLVREVVEWGGLEPDEEGHYRLSRKMFNLVSTSTRAFSLRELALPHLAELHRMTGLTVHLSVRDGDDAMYIEALRSHSNYSGENRIGGRMRLHVTATGLVLLAYADPAFVDGYLSRPLKRYTHHTPADPEEIQELLGEVRKRRYAIAERSIVLGAGAIAAPVFDEYGNVETCVGLVYLVGRDDPAKLVDLVRATAARISHTMTNRKAPPDPRTVDYNRRNAGLI